MMQMMGKPAAEAALSGVGCSGDDVFRGDV